MAKAPDDFLTENRKKSVAGADAEGRSPEQRKIEHSKRYLDSIPSGKPVDDLFQNKRRKK